MLINERIEIKGKKGKVEASDEKFENSGWLLDPTFQQVHLSFSRLQLTSSAFVSVCLNVSSDV